jgi:hypothetical protein
MNRAKIALLVLVGACARQRIPEARALVGGGTEMEISRVIEQALAADGRSEAAESLYAPSAVVIAEGRVRRGPPRFAGVGAEGEVAITNTQIEIRGTAAWGNVEYRWVSDRSNLAQVGRASFVVTPAQGHSGWWIVQAHSSVAK